MRCSCEVDAMSDDVKLNVSMYHIYIIVNQLIYHLSKPDQPTINEPTNQTIIQSIDQSSNQPTSCLISGYVFDICVL